ncbi:hypothetical protein DINM_001746 [Dirofilaria immitis]|nr:hypothetical protein [Dirofilaria immitis]
MDYNVPDETMDMVENELDKMKNLLMKVNTNIFVTDSLNAEWRGGFYFRNGFELLLPLRAVAKNLSDLPEMKQTINIKTNDFFPGSKTKFLDTTTSTGKHIFDDYFLSDAARRFLIRRELLRANNRRFILVPVSMWVLLASVVALSFVCLMRYGRIVSYGSLVVSIPLAVLSFQSSMRNFLAYGEMMLDYEACADSPEYVEGARQYLNSSTATNLRIRNALGDLKSEFIAANGDRVGDPWPYSKRLKAIEKLVAEQYQKKNNITIENLLLFMIFNYTGFMIFIKEQNGKCCTKRFEQLFLLRSMSADFLWKLNKRWARRIRVSVVSLTVASVPSIYLLVNGPYLKEYFEKRYDVSSVLSSHLQHIVDSVIPGVLEQLYHFILNFKRSTKLTITVKKLEPMIFMDEQACVVWESNIGRQIIETFVLSEDVSTFSLQLAIMALRFLIRRDLTAHEAVKRTALFTFYWFCYTSIAFMLAQIIVHYYFTGSVLWFCGLSFGLNAPACWGSVQNAKLDWHATDQSADADAARISLVHSKGGKEYYQKMLKRNRLLREIIPDGLKKISAIGNPNNSNTSYWSRYTSLVDLNAENKLLDKISAVGDS